MNQKYAFWAVFLLNNVIKLQAFESQAAHEQQKIIILKNILRARSWVFSNAAGWSLQNSSYLRQQQGHSGWGSAVFRAPSSGTQTPPRARSNLGGREGQGMLGSYHKCILWVHTTSISVFIMDLQSSEFRVSNW